jgi:hypothetical protein
MEPTIVNASAGLIPSAKPSMIGIAKAGIEAVGVDDILVGKIDKQGFTIHHRLTERNEVSSSQLIVHGKRGQTPSA